MSERDDELLRRYRSLAPEAPPASIDATILAASRRAVRSRPLARWAVPVSVAAVMVLALGLVIDMQREAPDAGAPVESRAPAPAAVAPERAGPPAAADTSAAQPPVEKPRALSKVEAKRAAPAPRAAQAPGQEPPAPAAKSAAPAAPVASAPTAPVASPSAAAAAALDATARANAAAPQAAQRSLAADPLARELERIVRLREEGKDDAADAALAAFRREHPDYRIEPAMWDRLRRR